MEQRININKIIPDAYKAMLVLDGNTENSGLDHKTLDIIKIRASQINGCAYCVNYHTKDAREHGETEQRIYLLSAWKEAVDIFTDEERLLLQMTEEITLIHKDGLTDAVYARAIAVFGAEKTAKIIMTIVTINAWNRIGVSTRLRPGS